MNNKTISTHFKICYRKSTVPYRFYLNARLLHRLEVLTLEFCFRLTSPVGGRSHHAGARWAGFLLGVNFAVQFAVNHEVTFLLEIYST